MNEIVNDMALLKFNRARARNGARKEINEKVLISVTDIARYRR